ncbi:MAG: B12-binding domain-containing radical SAM protein [Candidatus Hydrothermarchaeota archaeon]
MDELPFPARHLLKIEEYTKRLTTVVSSRGCPFSCSFCATPKISGRKWRARSPRNVVDEMQEIQKKFGFDRISFVDDNFTLNPSRVMEICEEIKNRGLEIFWGCESRVDTIVKNPPMVKKMSETGCTIVLIGVESASQKVLDDYGKKK